MKNTNYNVSEKYYFKLSLGNSCDQGQSCGLHSFKHRTV